MKQLLLTACLLLAGCMSEEDNIIIIRSHPHIQDTMHIHPDIRVQHSVYLEDL